MAGNDHYALCLRRKGFAVATELRGVAPGTLEARVSRWLTERECFPNNTTIVRVERLQDARYVPPSAGENADLRRSIADSVRLSEHVLLSVLFNAWDAAANMYRARAQEERDGRRYMLHDFAGVLRVSGSVGGSLTCLHPALTTEADDVFPMMGEARLDLARTSIVLEFGGEISRRVGEWQNLSLGVPGARRTPYDFAEECFFVG